MGTRDASKSFLKVAMPRGEEAWRRRRGKQRILEDDDKEDNEEDGGERRGKARLREVAVVTVEAIAMGMVQRCRGGASALRRWRAVGAVRRARGAAARVTRRAHGAAAGGGVGDGA